MRGLGAAAVATAVATFGLASASGAQTASVPGVTAKTITVGYLYSRGGIAGSTFQRAGDAFQARIDRENAKGGVNGRKIKTEIIDDSGTENNLAGAQDLVQRRNVFAVLNNSSFAFLSYRYLEQAGVPMIGGGFDGQEYGQAGNEDLISMGGNMSGVVGGTAYKSSINLFKRFGAKNVAALGYGISPSSSAAAKNFQKYTVQAQGLNAVYTNTSVDFGTTDVGPLVLGMKNAGADSVYLPLVASTNFAILSTARQNGLSFKLAILATGYGQPLLDDPIVSTLGPNDLMASGYAPVELKTKATKQFQADLKKYAHFNGVPDYGQDTGYVIADLFIAGLKAEGKNVTRAGFIDAVKGLKGYNQGGLNCQTIDYSRANFGKAAPTACGWYVYVKNKKFVVYNNGEPIRSTLVANVATATTTTGAP